MANSLELGFTKVVVWACARLIEMFDEPTMALEILKESGVDASVADEYDKAFIRKAQREE